VSENRIRHAHLDKGLRSLAMSPERCYLRAGARPRWTLSR
jgi:hypothetical protein